MASYGAYGQKSGCGWRVYVFGGLGFFALLLLLVLLFPKELETIERINAKPARVWRHVIDFGSYSSWNPHVAWMRGEARKGAPVDIGLAARDVDPVEFKATITVANEGEELRWSGRAGLPLFFDADHTIQLRPTEDGGTYVIQRGDYRGIVPFLLWWKIEPFVEQAFASHNGKLKEVSER